MQIGDRVLGDPLPDRTTDRAQGRAGVAGGWWGQVPGWKA